MTTFVYDYPDGQEPKFWIHEDQWVMAYPKGAKRYFRKGQYWHRFPEGGAPVLREHEGFLWDLDGADKPRFYLREVAQ